MARVLNAKSRTRRSPRSTRRALCHGARVPGEAGITATTNGPGTRGSRPSTRPCSSARTGPAPRPPSAGTVPARGRRPAASSWASSRTARWQTSASTQACHAPARRRRPVRCKRRRQAPRSRARRSPAHGERDETARRNASRRRPPRRAEAARPFGKVSCGRRRVWHRWRDTRPGPEFRRFDSSASYSVLMRATRRAALA